MRHRTRLLSLLALALSACDEPATNTDSAIPATDSATRDGGRTDAGLPLDAGNPIDGGAIDGGPSDGGMPIDSGGGTDSATPGCGGARPSISMIRRTEGLVIGRDGTIYYSQSGGVGRLRPGGSMEKTWVTISGARTVWGLALDAANTYLYVGSPATGSIHRVDIAAGTSTEFLASAGSPNGLTIGPDGALYYSDFEGDRVYRVATGGATGTRAEVTASPIAAANGVAFLADGTLLVASYSTGTIHRLTLSGGVETGRAPFVTGPTGADGLAVDAAGRVYVASQSGGAVHRYEADGTGMTMIRSGISGVANIEFGAGALDCEDLYMTAADEMQRYEMGTTPGAAVPWH